jgi:hypothetical protein
MKIIKIKNRGYVTLISAIIISAVLMSVMLNQSLFGFHVRFSVLNHEKKTASFFLALSCVEIVKIKLSDQAVYVYGGNEIIDMVDGNCQVDSVYFSQNQITFTVNALYKDAKTTLKAVVDSDNFNLISKKEL